MADTQANNSHDPYALIVAEKLGTLTEGVSNLAQRIDLMRDDQRRALDEVRADQRRGLNAHDERLDEHDLRISAVEKTLDNPDPKKHLSPDELISFRARVIKGHENWQMRIMLASSVAGPIVAYLLARFH